MTARTATATQRPGCRTGTTVSCSAGTSWAVPAVEAAVTSSPRSGAAGGVDGGLLERALLDPPGLQDLPVVAGVDQLLDGATQRLGVAAVVLLQRHAVR